MNGNAQWRFARNEKRAKNDILGVSEVVGTILLVAISVVMVSIIGLYLVNLPPQAPSNRTNLVATFDPDTNNITLEHKGGANLRFDYVSISLMDSAGIKVADPGISDGDFIGDANEIWEAGEKWNYHLEGTYGNTITVSVVDLQSDLQVLSQRINLAAVVGIVPDIEIRGNGIQFNATEPDERSTIPVYLRFYNVGAITIDDDLVIRVMDNFAAKTKVVGTFIYTRDLQPEASGSLEVTWTPSSLFSPSVGQHEIEVEISPLAGEINVGNNRASAEIFIRQHITEVTVVEPDLAVSASGIEVTPSYPTNGDDVAISAYVLNYGDTAATVDIEFYDGDLVLDQDGNVVENGTLIGVEDDIYVKSSRTVAVTWTTSSGGLHTISVGVVNVRSEEETLPETNFGNNNASVPLYIKPTILLVGDDNSTSQGTLADAVARLRDSISAVGFTYDYYYVTPGGSGPKYDTGLNQLSSYDIVVWSCGFDSGSTLKSDDISNLETYLDNGGHLWLIGTDLLDDLLDGSPAGGQAFVRDYLGVEPSSVTMDVNLTTVNGTYNDILNLSESANYLTHLSVPSPYNSQADVFDVYSGFNGNVSGLLYDAFNDHRNISCVAVNHTLGSKVAFFSWEFGLLQKHSSRAILAYRVLSWLGAELGSGIRDLAVSDTEFSITTPKYMEAVNISAVVQNNGEAPETNVMVGFYVDDELISSYPDQKDSLQTGIYINGSGGTVTVYKEWLATSIGPHTIKVQVDPFNYIEEISELNNDITYSTLIDNEIVTSYNILVVDDDNRTGGPRDTTVNVTAALDDLGYDYDKVTVSSAQDGPSLNDDGTVYGTVMLKNYNTVIWNTGGETTTLTANDTEDLMDYLDGNYFEAQEFPEDIRGTLFLMGSGLLNDLTNVSYPGQGINFIQNYLHLDPGQIALDVGTPSMIYGVEDDAITHGMEYPTMDVYEDGGDAVRPVGGSGCQGIFKSLSGYFGSDGRWVDYSTTRYNATRYHEDQYDVVFLPFDMSFLGGSEGGGGTRGAVNSTQNVKGVIKQEEQTTRSGTRAELLTNGGFDGDYAGWTKNEVTHDGSNGYSTDDHAGSGTSGSIYVSATTHWTDNTRQEHTTWTQNIGPTTNQLTVNGYYKKEYSEDHNGCTLDTVWILVRVYDTGDGNWHNVLSYTDTSESDTGWQQFTTQTYTPLGSVSQVRVVLNVEVTGTWTGWSFNTNTGTLKADGISVDGTPPGDPPDAPSNPLPSDGATGVGTDPTLSVDVSDPDGDTMDVTFHDASDDSVIGTDNNVASGGTATVNWNGLSGGTTYDWYAVADDGALTTQSATWSFTTNTPPDAPSGPSPNNGATEVSTSPTLVVSVSDPDGDTMDVTFYDASDDSVIGTDSGVNSGGTASVVWSGLSAGTDYSWYAVAADPQGASTTSPTWSFSTSTYTGPYLANGYVDPLSGDTSTLFTYHVTYYSQDASPDPSEAKVYIDGDPVGEDLSEADPGDSDFSDGKEYVYNTTLPIGSAHVFRFKFTIPGDTLWLPVIAGSTFSGPIVNPAEYQSVHGREMETELVYMTMRWFGIPDDRPELKTSKIDVSLSDPHPMLGDAYVLKTTVFNYGDADATTTVRILDGDTIIDTQTVYVGAGGSSPVETIWTPLFAGNRPVTFAIDPANDISEVFDTLNNNGTRLDPIVYFFYDDMESGPGNWDHDATVARINGEGKLDYMDEPTNSNINDTWEDMQGFQLNTEVENINVNSQYHSAPRSYFMHEQYGAVTQQVPIDVALGIDSSGSMGWNDPDDVRIDGAKTFIDQLVDPDRVAVYDFDSDVDRIHDLDSDYAAAKAAVDTIDSNGGTALYDCGIEALNYMGVNAGADGERVKALILLTDGEDYNSAHTLAQYKTVRDSCDDDPETEMKIYVFTINLIDGDENVLKDMCTQPWDSGPFYYKASSGDDLIPIYDQISEVIENLAEAEAATRGGEDTRAEVENPWSDGTGTNSDKYLMTHPIDLRNVDTATLSFYHKYNMKIGSNGGVILVGTSDVAGGPYTYHYVQPKQPYTGNILLSEMDNQTSGYTEAEVTGLSSVRPPWCWNGISGGGTLSWDYIEVDLDEFAGDFVKVVFYYIFTTGGTGYGWIVDDVTVKVGRDDDNPNKFGSEDNWILNQTSDPAYAHSGSHAWWCGDEGNFLNDTKDGVDNSLYTRPIDLTNARTATLRAFFKFNIQYDAGRPPDGFRVEASTDNKVTWIPLNLGVRAAWNVSGNESDISDGVMDGKSYSGIDAGNNWVRANTLTRLETSLTGFTGNVIVLRFRVVTNTDGRHYQDSSKWGGFYVDDVVVSGQSLASSRRNLEETVEIDDPAQTVSVDAGPDNEQGMEEEANIESLSDDSVKKIELTREKPATPSYLLMLAPLLISMILMPVERRRR